jgi:hypothetical protein
MGIREDLNNQLYNDELKAITTNISELRQKLWKEGKIRLEGLTYSEWKERNRS